jgi:phytoene dehydrogenase-like protein
MKSITIIGAGLGGLTAGALLAKDGYKVTLLEQHNIVGGCATTFKRGDFICEVGLHEMDGVYTNPQIKKIFNKLDVYKNIEFVKADEFFKINLKDDEFIMPDGVDEAKSALNKKFPHEKQGIEKYFKLLESISKCFENLQNMKWHHYALFPFMFFNLLRYKDKSVSEVFDTLFRDTKLKLILNANVQYYNDTPDTLSFLLHCVAQYSYFKGGGYFIKGGSGRLSDYLASIITNNGGEIILKANVIECKKDEVKYIKKHKVHTIKSDTLISNLSPLDTHTLFKKPYIETKQIADSLLTIYIGFSKNIKEHYGKGAYSNFIYDDMDSIDKFNESLKKDITKRGFVFVDYSQLDSKLTSDPSKSFGAICMTDFIEDWQALSKDEYKQKKLDLEKEVIKKLETHYPNISKYIEYIETGTAKTVQRYIKTPNATAYGYKPTPKQFFKIPKVKSDKVDNLYFVGQWVIAGGFSPSISSGYMCYKLILDKIPTL